MKDIKPGNYFGSIMIDIIIPTLRTLKEIRPMIDEIEKNTIIDHKIIVTCQPVSAAMNRNFGLDCAMNDILIMIDDDISGFFKGWAKELIKPLEENEDIIMVSARCMNSDGTLASTGACDYDISKPLSYVPKLKQGILPTSAIAFRKMPFRFDENYKGAAFEDADFCFQIFIKNPVSQFVINNECKLIHLNERKGYGGAKEHNTFNPEEDKILWENRAYFHKKWNVK